MKRSWVIDWNDGVDAEYNTARILEPVTIGPNDSGCVAVVTNRQDNGEANANLISTAPDYDDTANKLVQKWDRELKSLERIISNHKDGLDHEELCKSYSKILAGLAPYIAELRKWNSKARGVRV